MTLKFNRTMIFLPILALLLGCAHKSSFVNDILLQRGERWTHEIPAPTGLGSAVVKYKPNTFPFVADVEVRRFSDKKILWRLEEAFLDNVRLSGDLRYIVAVSHFAEHMDVPGEVTVYAAPVGKPLFSKKLAIVGQVSFSDQSNAIAIEDRKQGIFVYSLVKGEVLYQLPHSSYFALSSDGLNAATVSDSKLKIFSKGTLLTSTELPTMLIRGVDIAASSPSAVVYWKTGFLVLSKKGKKKMAHVSEGNEILGATCDPKGQAVWLAIMKGDDKQITLTRWRSKKGFDLEHRIERRRPVERLEWVDCSVLKSPDRFSLYGGGEASWVNVKEVIK